MEILYNQGDHKNIWLEDYGHGLAVQANQHLIVHDGKGFILDPGGHKAYKQTITQLAGLIKVNDLEYIFLSHQDPDIVAAVNGWLMTTDAVALCSKLWVRFVPHFGVDKLVEHRLKSIPDEGCIVNLGDCKLHIIPAHFMHSVGNFQVYDPISKILYSGDLGASLGMDYPFVDNFNDHIRFMEGFHQRYMSSNKILKLWVNMVRNLDIEIIAPQHGAVFKGKAMVESFLNWCEQLQCGMDLMDKIFTMPQTEFNG